MIYLDTTEAALYLKAQRGIEVQPRTVKIWCQRGKFPNAQRIGGTRRGYWQIPKEDLDALIQRPAGRPKKPNDDPT